MINGHLTRADLLARGWTAQGIRIFMPEPCRSVPNPWYRNSAPVPLYDVARVEAIERTTTFQSWKREAEKRKAAARKAVATKKLNMQEWANNLVVEVPMLSQRTAIRKACEHYNERQARRAASRGVYLDDWWEPASPESDSEFLNRITVNYLRHAMTDYDERLEDIFGRTGGQDVYETIAVKTYEAIARHYPWLAIECDRQLARKFPQHEGSLIPDQKAVAGLQLSLL